MLTLIVLFLILSSGSILCASVTQKRYEEILPITTMSIVLIIFVFGIMGILKTGVYVVLGLAVAAYLLAGIEIIKHKNFHEFSQKILTPGFAAFVFLFVLLTYINKGKVASAWDEFSHWMDIVKVMTTLDDFGTNPAAHSVFQAYPPAISIFQYFIQKIGMMCQGTAFVEWWAYFAYQLFFLIPAFPFLKKQSFKNMGSCAILFACILLCPNFFYSTIYKYTYVDGVLAMLAGLGLAMVFLWDDKDFTYTVYIAMLCSMLVLCKDAGMFSAVFLAGAYMIDMVISRKEYREKGMKSIVLVVLALVPAVLLLLSKSLWILELKTSHASTLFPGKVDLQVVKDLIAGRDNTYHTKVLSNFITTMFAGGVRLEVFGITISYTGLYILEIFLLWLGARMYKCKSNATYRSGLVTTGVVAVMIVIYAIGLGFTYIFKFGEYEATELASFDRYIGIAYGVAAPMIVLIFLDALQKLEKRSRVQEVSILCALLLVIPLSQVCSVMTRANVKTAQNVRAKYEPICQKIYENTPEDCKIYFISQEDSGFDDWVTRFSIRPREINEGFSWSIGEPFYEGDMWTKKMTPEQWRSELVEDYDYVALYKVNEYFTEKFGSLFEDSSQITGNQLYRINKETGMLSLVAG